MPQITTKVLSFAVLGVLALALSGCGDANPQATFDPAAGKHPANWLPSGHSDAAEEDINGCAECHGQDLRGGIAKVSCVQCHVEVPTSVHPVLWGQVAYALHPGYVQAHGSTSCAVAECHGTNLLGGASAPSCGINCHQGGNAAAPQIHAWGGVSATTAADITGHIQWMTNVANQVNGHFNYATCRNDVCHGATLQGVWLSGPACTKCHNSGPPAE
ncbi:hypothetical protein KP004_03505 [Geomonas oryzisoli]|uniref:CxxxxCH/CxxCH domain-containing protein n=1 Tax=Geomonas oryzisoli TaxID=2847992 RepID=A0ABX8J749_9BACT|nr:hypothetical protein [Geomonas oryzisoli]QWV94264.1 hypothetical protein KP004_03505 [Geomonas oryzisoli]